MNSRSTQYPAAPGPTFDPVLLAVGDKFRFKNWRDLVGMLPGNVPTDGVYAIAPCTVNWNRLRFDHGSRIQCTWREYRRSDDGRGDWTRIHQEEVVNTSVMSQPWSEELAAAVWTVGSVALTGGGAGHGEHDVFPDGHFVTAGCGSRSVSFYQTGCFTGLQEPKDIERIPA